MKKIVVMILIVISILSIEVCFASYSDIDNSKYKVAIENLSDLSIISGYEDGTYKPEKVVTRAEMAKLLVATMEINIDNASNEVIFNDVGQSHWAIKYINVAQKNGLIKGDGDGNFRPNDTVNYSEMFTMIIRMLGYDVSVEGVGNWPDNYITKAKELNLVENLDDFNVKDGSNRGTVAQVIYNGIKNVYTRDDYVLVKTFNLLFDAYTGKTSKENLICMYTNGKNSIKTDLKFNFDVYKNTEFYKNLNEEEIKQLNLYRNIINNSNLNVELDFDLLQKYAQGILKYIYKDEELGQMQINIDKENMYLSLKDVFDGYYKEKVDFSSMNEMLYEIKDEIFNEIIDNSNYYCSYEEFQDISPKMLALVKRTIFNETMNLDFKKEKATISINGENKNVIKVSIMLSEENFNNYQKNYLLDIKNDEELIKEKYAYLIVGQRWPLEKVKKYIDEEIEYYNREIDYQEKYNAFNIYIDNNSNSLMGFDINTENFAINYRVKGKDYIKLQIDFIEPYDSDIKSMNLEIVKNVNDIYNCKLNIKYINYDEEEVASFDIYGSVELSNKIITKPDFSNSFNDFNEISQQKINSKIEEIVTKIGLKEQYEAYIEMKKNIVRNAKKAVFMNDVATMQDTVTLAKLNNLADMYGTNKTINNEYYNVIDGVNKEDKNLSNAKILGSIKVSEYQGSGPIYGNIIEVANDQEYITKDITLYKISDSINENLNSIDLSNFGIDENGIIYYYKGVIIDSNTYYNNTNYFKGKVNGAINIVDYR